MSRAAVSLAMAGGDDIHVLMASLVKGIYAGAPSQVEARKIAQALAGAAWCAERGRPVASAVSRNDLLESTLTALSRVAGCDDKFRIEGAKRWLRDGFGEEGRKIAGRLGKLSKARNSETHPDDMIIDEVKALVQRRSEIHEAGSAAHSCFTSEGADIEGNADHCDNVMGDLCFASKSVGDADQKHLLEPRAVAHESRRRDGEGRSNACGAETFDIASHCGDEHERSERWADLFSSCGSADDTENNTFDGNPSRWHGVYL